MFFRLSCFSGCCDNTPKKLLQEGRAFTQPITVGKAQRWELEAGAGGGSWRQRITLQQHSGSRERWALVLTSYSSQKFRMVLPAFREWLLAPVSLIPKGLATGQISTMILNPVTLMVKISPHTGVAEFTESEVLGRRLTSVC